MASLYPVSSGRTSNILNHTRLLSQIASDQLALLKRQDQISTGRRISTPSEDSQAALRAVGLQRLLEQKDQFTTNLLTSESYLSASENSVSDISELLISIRGTALSVTSTTSSDEEREAAATSVRNAVSQLADSLNKTFRGRYLFGGTNADGKPIEFDEGYVVYNGDEGKYGSFADIDLRLDTSVTGHEVVGTISPEVRGTVNLNPILTSTTRLSDLRGGNGVELGSFELSSGSTSNIVDVSSAETIGDIARLLESNAPAGTQIHARVSGDHLDIEFLAPPGETLVIGEVGGGITASELGILGTTTTQNPFIVGQDLDPTIKLTTRLDEVFGSHAQAVSRSPNDNNNIIVTAKQPGSQFNGYGLQFVDDDLLQAANGLQPGQETATLTATDIAARAALSFTGLNNDIVLTAATTGTGLNDVSIQIADGGVLGNAAIVNYDPLTKVLTVSVDSGNNTEIQTVINEINSEGTFSTAYDSSNPADGGFVATATVSSLDAGVVSGNTGNSGAQANTLLVNINSGLSSAQDVVSALQNNTQISALFDITLDTKDTPIDVNAGTGLVDVAASAVTTGGSGVDFDKSSGLQIVNGDETHTLTFDTAETVQDVLNILNGSSAHVLAEINSQANGINIRSVLSGSDFHIGENGGSTATELGVRSLTAETKLSDFRHGFGVSSRTGVDFYITRNDGTEFEIDISTAATVDDVIQLINNHVDNQVPATHVEARLASYGNGLELVADNPSGATTLAVRANGDAAIDLGLIPEGQPNATAIAAQAATAALAFPAPNDLNTAISLAANQVGTGLDGYDIVFNDTQSGNVAIATLNVAAGELIIDLDSGNTTATTIVNAINLEGSFTAQLDLTNDPSNDGSGTPAASGLIGTTTGGTADVLQGNDKNPLEVKGAFNSLLRLDAALRDFDLPQIERAIAMLDEDFSQLNFARAELGIQQQQIDIFRGRIETEKIELSSTLSEEIEVDLAEAISGMLQQQAAYQASLQLMGQTFQLSLLDFI